MHRKQVCAIAVTTALLAASVCLAMYEISNQGSWPKTWPWPLEGLRGQARTIMHNTEEWHEIPFANREELEAKWPHILSLKSKGAPLVLVNGPSEWVANTVTAGVRVRSPLTGHLVTPDGLTIYPPGAEDAVKGGRFLKIGPPWPDYLHAADGSLPEYVVIDGDKWKAQDPKELRGARIFRIWRARTEIELIVDGQVVDLNRIPLPADTPIIDKRFAKGKDKPGK